MSSIHIAKLIDNAEQVRRARGGMIEVIEGELSRIVFRSWPKLVSILGVRTLGRWEHLRWSDNGLRIYYHQPRSTPNYLAVNYFVSGRNTTWETVRRGLAILDRVAQLKRSDAIVCDVANPRISARMLERHGWEPLPPRRWHRYFIRRFYGRYPQAGSPADVQTAPFLPTADVSQPATSAV